MPIIGSVGRRSWKVRALNITIHAVLIIGSISMIYPMLLMLSGSVKSNLDRNEMDPVPDFFTSDAKIFQKYIETKYNEKVDLARTAHRKNYFSFETVEPPDILVPEAVADWREYLTENPPEYTEYELGFTFGNGIIPKNWRLFKKSLQKRYNSDIRAMDEDLGTFYNTWWEMIGSAQLLYTRGASLAFAPMQQEFHNFKRDLPIEDKYVYNLSGLFVEDILKIKYSSDIEEINRELGTSYVSYSRVNLTQEIPDGPMRDNWLHFVKNSVNLQYVYVRSEEEENYREFLQERYQKIANLNRVYEAEYSSFAQIPLPEEQPSEGVEYADFEYFVVNSVQPENLYLQAPEFEYRNFLRQRYGSVEAVNEAYDLGYRTFDTIPLTSSYPKDNVVQSKDWLEFVRQNVPAEELVLDRAAAPDYLSYLREKYLDPETETIDVAKLNSAYGTKYQSELDIIMPKPPITIEGQNLEDWREFVKEVVRPVYYQIAAEKYGSEWQNYLQAQYVQTEELNQSWATIYSDFIDIAPPYLMTDWMEMKENKWGIFWEFFSRNYRMVFEYLVLHGRGLVNTVIYCGLSVLALLLVNPIGAYALSRYRLPSTYKILLFCMLTMTFPPMVLGIPNFLLLKQLGLLNTFAGLILPAMANGYSIFLLKGFFDSLPQELYEAATIDGAGEFTMFWNITMALSKPILAVIALQGFTRAYANFMMAFIICQDERMWTLMVWLYQLQQMASQPVVFASLVIAGLPTLLLFIFCQKIILRGIVVPVEK